MGRNLPDGYTSRCETKLDSPASTPAERLQQVYEFIRYLINRGGIDRIVAIGSTSITGLKALDLALPAVCIDRASSLDFVMHNIPAAQFFEWDLETSLPAVPIGSLSKTLIICADLIGRLRRPEVLLMELARLSRECAYVIISTLDRVRTRGFMHSGPPPEPTSIMEWTADEFGRLMLECGFQKDFVIGYTFSAGLDSSKNTIFAIAGREATFVPPQSRKTVTAIMHIYNEEDVIGAVAKHLEAEGVKLHLIDNWSTDRTYEIAHTLVRDGLCERVTRFPQTPPDDFDLSSLLSHVTQYAATLDSDWIVYSDADEFRTAPWPEATLAEAISFVDELGYAAIDFTIMNFYPTATNNDREFSSDSCKLFDFGRHPAHFLQIKAWKNQGRVVDLVSTGGHLAQFPDGRVYPLKFLNRHYPLRSAEQASRKILHDRLPRTERERRRLGWHDHYNEFRGAIRVEPWCRHELLHFDANMFNADYLLERLSGIGIEQDRRAATSIAQFRATIDRCQTALTDSQAKLDQARLEIASQQDGLTNAQSNLNQARLEIARQQNAVTDSEGKLHQANLEIRRQKNALTDAESKLDQAKLEIAQLKTECSGLATSLAAVQSSISWKVTRPLRRLRLLASTFFRR
jgi:glycosyltransferase involved in cell wall biosynthesis